MSVHLVVARQTGLLSNIIWTKPWLVGEVCFLVGVGECMVVCVYVFWCAWVCLDTCRILRGFKHQIWNVNEKIGVLIFHSCTQQSNKKYLCILILEGDLVSHLQSWAALSVDGPMAFSSKEPKLFSESALWLSRAVWVSRRAAAAAFWWAANDVSVSDLWESSASLWAAKPRS